MKRILMAVREHEWLVFLLTMFILGMCFGLWLGTCYLGSEVEVIMLEDAKPTIREQLIEEVARAEATQYDDSGALLKIFSADLGLMVGPRTYRFEQPRLIELHPGTNKVKTFMSADHAEMEFESGVSSEVLSAKWWGNFKQRTHSLEGKK